MSPQTAPVPARADLAAERRARLAAMLAAPAADSDEALRQAVSEVLAAR